MADSTAPDPEDVLLPLRDRLPDYLAIFGIGWAAMAVAGGAIALLTSATMVEGVAYAAVAGGVVLLLGGGATGGGYTNLGLGAAGSVLGSGQRHDEDYEDAEVRRGRTKKVNPRDRLRKGLRPEKNPRAFWQVMAGFTYLAIAITLLRSFGS
ncbi:MAG: hypothetical protein GY926_07745 [bacterium]|nr:hypothetical protein [bacterium]MCP4965114.1 hypothetical protein [bacterium]